MKVLELYNDSAVLSTLNDYLLSNLQINDIATIKAMQ